MTDELNKAISFFTKYPGLMKTSGAKMAKRIGVSFDDVTEAKSRIRKEKRTVTNSNRRTIDKIEEAGLSESYEEFLIRNNIDEADVTNAWFKERASGTYFSVETRKRRDELEDERFDIIEELKASIDDYKVPTLPTNSSYSTKERLGIINLFDAHIDKAASIDTSDENSSIERNMELFESGFDEILMSIKEKNPEEILIPVGGDFWHTNDFSRSTKRGTYMGEAVDMDPRKTFRLGINLIRRCIDKARIVAPVTIISIRGNHDDDKVIYMLESLLIAYENVPRVTIIDSYKARQYYRFGSWLFGFTHGDKQRNAKDLPSLMSTDADSKKHWSSVKRGVYFLGDIHHEKAFDMRGCSVRYLRSAGPSDEWHWEHGYTAIPKTAYGFVYEKDGSREYEFKVNI